MGASPHGKGTRENKGKDEKDARSKKDAEEARLFLQAEAQWASVEDRVPSLLLVYYSQA